jgi:hypothetical protein
MEADAAESAGRAASYPNSTEKRNGAGARLRPPGPGRRGDYGHWANAAAMRHPAAERDFSGGGAGR